MHGESRPFTRVWAGMLAAVAEANVSGKELVVLISLMRYQQDEGSEVWRPVSEIAAECGLSGSNVRNRLASLTRKTFKGADGSPVPVITRVREGHRGRVATYIINLPRESATNALPNTNLAGDANRNAQRIREESATFSAESATNPSPKRNNFVAPLEPIERIDKNVIDRGVFRKTPSPFPDRDEWIRFIEERELDECFADEWSRLESKDWVDADGLPIHDWRAYLLRISERVNKSYESKSFDPFSSVMSPSEYMEMTGSYPPEKTA